MSRSFYSVELTDGGVSRFIVGGTSNILNNAQGCVCLPLS